MHGCTGNQDKLATGQSAACNLFLQQSGNIECMITGARRHCSDLSQVKLEVLCTLHFSGDVKVEKTPQTYSTSNNINQ